jgi:hypothetical protein
MSGEKRYITEQPKDFRETLAEAWNGLHPERPVEVAGFDLERAKEVERIDEWITEHFPSILKQYDVDPNVICENENGYCELPVLRHFSAERLPEGYGYKGGAARALLGRTLGFDVESIPRDVDVIRLRKDESRPGLDAELAQHFMPDDFSTGYGVEHITDLEEYLASRDITLNEVLATDEKIFATKQCIVDSIRHILRPTKYERRGWDADGFDGGLSEKILAKILRFYSDSIARFDDAHIEGVEDWEYEEYFISPFWVALNLDRAVEQGEDIALLYIRACARKGQLPGDITTVDEVVSYLERLLGDGRFYFRHAPVVQFDTERNWDQEQERFDSDEKLKALRF